MGEPSLHDMTDSARCSAGRGRPHAPNRIEEHLDRVVELLVLEFAFTDLVNASLEAALPRHELEYRVRTIY